MNAIKGLWRDYSEKRPDPEQVEYQDQAGKVYIVTGASGGVGAEVASKLAGLNAKVYLMARNQQKIESTCERIRQTRGKDVKLESMIMDFTDLSTIRHGVEQVLNAETRLDGVVHNAGCVYNGLGPDTKQGYEAHIGVNCMAPYLLQKLLDPVMCRTEDSRVVWVSSGAMFMMESDQIPWDDMGYKNKKVGAMERYSLSKLIMYAQAVHWGKLHPAHASVAVHPGFINSDLGRNGPSQLVVKTFMKLGASNAQGAVTELYGLLKLDAAEAKGEKAGAYLAPYGKLAEPSKLGQKLRGEEGAKLWAWLDERVKPYC